MKIAEAFHPRAAHVIAPPEKAGAYVIVHVANGRLTLEAQQAEQAMPSVGDVLTVQTLMDEVLYRVKVRVLELKVAGKPRLVLQQEGAIEECERRQHRRAVARWPVTLELPPPNGPVPLTTEDVNSQGMRVVSPAAVPVGTDLRFALGPLDDRRIISGTARVVRCVPMGAASFDLGLLFVDVPTAERERIVDMLLMTMFRPA